MPNQSLNIGITPIRHTPLIPPVKPANPAEKPGNQKDKEKKS